MQQELKTHIEKIEAKLLRHESTDTFTFEFVSDLVQSFKDIVEKPIDTTKDVYEIKEEWSQMNGKHLYFIYKNNAYQDCESTLEKAKELMRRIILKQPKIVYTYEHQKEVSNG
jgi:hypothetical protein